MAESKSSNNDEQQPRVPFTKLMRAATRDVHSLSDSLINAKIGLAMGSNSVWAEGLLVFYEIFRHLEEMMTEKPDSYLAQLDFPGLRRTELFEKDLEYYLGPNWRRHYFPRGCVREYLVYLDNMALTEPVLLLAYGYHLYMGLLSGGQILRRKRALLNKLKFNTKHSYAGLAVTEITGTSVYALKKQITEKMNEIANGLDDNTRSDLIKESKTVFLMNNVLVRSVEGTNSVLLWRVLKFSTFSLIIGLSAFLLKKVIS